MEKQDINSRLTLTAEEQCLLPLLFGKKLTAADIVCLTKELDVDHTGQGYLLKLSSLGYTQGWELFPPKILPRLKGIHRYHQVSNTLAVPWLVEKIGILAKAGIPVILLKGLAMRFYYDPGVPRVMGDYDIAVPEEQFERAMFLLQDEHSGKGSAALHHGQVEGEHKILEVHRWIFKHHGEKNSDIWERAVHFDFFGHDVSVLCPEDMFIHLLDNRVRDIFCNYFPKRRIEWLYDCRRVCESAVPLPGTEQIAARASQFDVTYDMCYIFPYFADAFPELYDPEKVRQTFSDSPGYEKWLDKGMKLSKARLRYYAKYTAQGPFSPLAVIEGLQMQYAVYRYMKMEHRQDTGWYGFLQFFLEYNGVNHWSELFSKYKLQLLPSCKKRRKETYEYGK